MKTIGYFRVSTVDKSMEKFEVEILRYCNDKDLGQVKFVEEEVSGTKPWKELELGKIIDNMSKWSVLVVPELSRLASSVQQICEIISVFKEKEIALYAIKENFAIHEDSSCSKETEMKISALLMVSGLERDLRSTRSKEVFKTKKDSGIKLGRPSGKSKLDSRRGEIAEYQKLGMNKTQIAKVLKCDRLTYMNWLEKEPKEIN